MSKHTNEDYEFDRENDDNEGHDIDREDNDNEEGDFDREDDNHDSKQDNADDNYETRSVSDDQESHSTNDDRDGNETPENRSDEIDTAPAYSGTQSGREKYSFDLNNGTVSAAFELEHGVKQRQSLDHNERYVVEGNDVLKIESKANGQEVSRYSDLDGDGLFAKVAEQWIGNGANTAGAPVITEALHYEGDERDEHIGLTTDSASLGGGGADQFVFRQLGHVTVNDFHHAEGDKLVFDTGLGLTSFAQLLGFVSTVRDNGQETVIEFGDSVSLTLVGVHASSLQVSDFAILS